MTPIWEQSDEIRIAAAQERLLKERVAGSMRHAP
jgi:hypothetical protein